MSFFGELFSGGVVKSIENGIKQWEEIFNYQKLTEVVVNSR